MIDNRGNNGNYYNQNTNQRAPYNGPSGMNNYNPNMNNMPPQQNYYGYNGMPQPPVPNNQGTKNNSAKLILLAVIAVLLIVVIIIGALLLIKKDKNNREIPQNNSVSSSIKSKSDDDSDDIYHPAEAPNEQYDETDGEKSYPSPVISWAETVTGTVLPSSNMNSSRSFGADQAIDGYGNTCWCVNTSSAAGAGGSFTVYLKEKSKVSGISIINGNTYYPSEELYKLNGQVRNFKLTFSDGTVLRYEASFNAATSQYETFRFSSPVVTDRITFTVESGYQGNTYTTNVCLGEIDVF